MLIYIYLDLDALFITLNFNYKNINIYQVKHNYIISVNLISP